MQQSANRERYAASGIPLNGDKSEISGEVRAGYFATLRRWLWRMLAVQGADEVLVVHEAAVDGSGFAGLPG
ncbi:hypothetical protein ACQP1P_43355 [Dactylosporangium sp. CA-052675]|uniref:hypothetical protein n=1 Tax=Dactylosporangium sp. CA-052675 TaxID=3239927 RepID=UPI003D9458F5